MSVNEYLPLPIIATGGGYHGKVIVHRDGKPPQVLKEDHGPIHSLSFCPTNPDLLASAGWDETVIVWDLKRSSNIKRLQCPAGLYSVCWSCDGQHLAAGCYDQKCYVFDARQDYKQMCVLERHTSSVSSVAFHPQSPAVCAATSSDGTVRVWQLSSSRSQQSKCLNVLRHGRDAAYSCCWLPDGKHLVSGGDECVVRLWNVEDGTEVAKFEGHSNYVLSVAASPDGRMIASGSRDSTCRIWEAKPGGKQLQELNHPHAVWAVSFASDGLHVVTGCHDGNTRVWSIAVGKVVVEIGGHEGPISCLAVPPTNCQAGATDAASSTGQRQQERRGRNDEE